MTVPDRMLRVDLSAERVRSEPVPEEWLARYVGGKGSGRGTSTRWNRASTRRRR